MPVSDGLWASIESQIPVKKERPKFWLLFLLCACAISFGILTSDQASNLSFPATNTNAKVAENDAAEKIDDSTQGNIISQKIDNMAANGSVSSSSFDELESGINTVSLSEATSDDYGNSSSNSISTVLPNTQLLSTTNSLATLSSPKKLKFVNNPFRTASNKTSKRPALKLIEKSRIYKHAEQLNSMASLGDNFYKKGIACNNKIDLADYGNVLPIDKYSVAACPSFEPYSSGLYFYADIISAYSFQKLEAIDQEFQGLVGLRNSKEKGAVSISANIGLGKQWSSGLLLETGLNYDRISVNSSQYAEDTPPRLMITIDSVLTPVGWEITRDSSYVDYSGDGMMKNRFSQFNIPVVMGYETLLSERISLITKAGILINIASRNRGQISNPEGDLVSYDSNEIGTSLFKTNMGLSYTGSLHLQAEVTPLLAAYTGLNVNYYPDNFGMSSNPIKQTYTKIGLSAGLKYRL